VEHAEALSRHLTQGRSVGLVASKHLRVHAVWREEQLVLSASQSQEMLVRLLADIEQSVAPPVEPSQRAISDPGLQSAAPYCMVRRFATKQDRQAGAPSPTECLPVKARAIADDQSSVRRRRSQGLVQAICRNGYGRRRTTC